MTNKGVVQRSQVVKIHSLLLGFNSKQSRRGKIIRFLEVFILSYASNFVVLLILIHSMGVHKGISQVLAGVVYVFVSYLMNTDFRRAI